MLYGRNSKTKKAKIIPIFGTKKQEIEFTHKMKKLNRIYLENKKGFTIIIVSIIIFIALLVYICVIKSNGNTNSTQINMDNKSSNNNINIPYVDSKTDIKGESITESLTKMESKLLNSNNEDKLDFYKLDNEIDDVNLFWDDSYNGFNELSYDDIRYEIINEIISAWNVYKKCGYGLDVVHPRSCSGGEGGFNMGLTLIDTLDLLMIIKNNEKNETIIEYFDNEIKTAIKWITDNLDHNEIGKKHGNDVSLFEGTIRIVGGLLSAYHLSNNEYPILLEKCKHISDLLMHAYNTGYGMLIYCIYMY